MCVSVFVCMCVYAVVIVKYVQIGFTVNKTCTRHATPVCRATPHHPVVGSLNLSNLSTSSVKTRTIIN